MDDDGEIGTGGETNVDEPGGGGGKVVLLSLGVGTAAHCSWYASLWRATKHSSTFSFFEEGTENLGPNARRDDSSVLRDLDRSVKRWSWSTAG